MKTPVEDAELLVNNVFISSRLHRKCRSFWPGSRTWRATAKPQRRPDRPCSRGRGWPRKSTSRVPSTTGPPRSRSTKGSSTGEGRAIRSRTVKAEFDGENVSLKPSQKNFVAIVDLPEGEHQYKFCIDGQWTLDPTGVRKWSSVMYLHWEVMSLHS